MISGSYGVREDELGIEDVDIVCVSLSTPLFSFTTNETHRSLSSDHYYPTYKSRLSSAASLAHSGNKAFLAGEYDWTNSLYSKLRWAWWAMALPVVIAAVIWAWPGKKQRKTTPRGVMSCGGCGRKRRRRRKTTNEAVDGETTPPIRPETPTNATSYPPLYPHPVDSPSSASTHQHDSSKSLFASSSSALPMLPSSPSSTTLPRNFRISARRTSWLDRPFLLRRWYFSLAVLVVLLSVLGTCLHIFLPSSITAFLSHLSSLSTTPIASSSPSAIGDLYWSLFGRDDSCCNYVQHDDGYTLHYPSDPSASSGAKERGSGEAVAMLTRHAWEVRGERPWWLMDEGRAVKDLRLEDLPVVSCPQEGLTLANGTVVGG